MSLIPLVRHDYWVFRVFEYPRIQKLVLNGVLFAGFLLFYELVTIHDKIFAAALSLNLSYLVFQVYPFTVLGKKELLRLKTESPEQQLGLFIGNVYQYNIKMLRSI